MLTPFLLTSIVLILSLIWVFLRRSKSRGSDRRKIPGIESSNNELGNLGDVARAGSLHQFLQDLHGRFGPIVEFSWLKSRVVSVASSKSFHETRRIFDRPILLFSSFEPLIGSSSIQYANGEMGKYRRKTHHDAAFLTAKNLKNDFEQIFREIFLDEQSFWEKKQIEERFPLHEQMLILTMKSIVSAAFGTCLNDEDLRTIESSYEICWNQMEDLLRGESMNEERTKRFERARSFFFDKVKEIIDRRREKLGADRKCFIDFLLDDQDNVLTDDDISNEVLTMFIGGFHTTGNLLTWIFYFLCKNPSIQQRLFDELNIYCPNPVPTIDEIDRSSFLQNVIDESLRLSVLAPWAARISNDEDLFIEGYRVPAGTPIIQALGVVLQDEKIWRNPQTFDPDRFSSKNQENIPSFIFSPFGFAGKRICPGHRFARYEAAFFVTAILKKFRLTLIDPDCHVLPVHGLVTSPNQEIFLRLERRNSSN